jgi:MFS family permease
LSIETSKDLSRGIGPATPVMAVVFLAFIVVGMALPVLPLHIHDVLGFGPAVVGLVTGAQFVAALISRLWAGRISDIKGPKHAVLLGIIYFLVGGAFYVVSLLLLDRPVLSVVALLIGRTSLGGAESLLITGGMAWGVGLVSWGTLDNTCFLS